MKTIRVRSSESGAGYPGKWRVDVHDSGNRVFGYKKIVLNNILDDTDRKFEVIIQSNLCVERFLTKSNLYEKSSKCGQYIYITIRGQYIAKRYPLEDLVCLKGE